MPLLRYIREQVDHNRDFIGYCLDALTGPVSMNSAILSLTEAVNTNRDSADVKLDIIIQTLTDLRADVEVIGGATATTLNLLQALDVRVRQFLGTNPNSFADQLANSTGPSTSTTPVIPGLPVGLSPTILFPDPGLNLTASFVIRLDASGSAQVRRCVAYASVAGVLQQITVMFTDPWRGGPSVYPELSDDDPTTLYNAWADQLHLTCTFPGGVMPKYLLFDSSYSSGAVTLTATRADTSTAVFSLFTAGPHLIQLY